jgi:acetyl esterase/lipase
VGTLDPLIDDSYFMASRWAAAGAAADLHIYPGGVHAFDMFDLNIAHQFHRTAEGFLNAH